jgi:simple sugar transport system permease protein
MRLEPIAAPSPMLSVAYPAAAIAATFAIASALVLAAGASPLDVFALVAKGAAGSQFALFETLTRATPLIFTGLAVAVAFRARLWNIGAEAQLYAGAIVTVVLGTGALPLPAVILIPLLIAASLAAGALLLLVPATLKLRLGVDEVVTTLLFNFIMLLFVSMLLEGVLKDPTGLGWPQSQKLVAEARLPRVVTGRRLHYGFVLAVVAAAVVWVIMKKTALGFEMRAVGHNPEAARFAGIPVNRVLVKTALLSGGLAALAGFSEVSGLKGNLTLDLSAGYGYTGIVVAMLALLNPLGVVVSAIFVAGIFVGADAMSRAAGVPSYIADVMVALALITMVVAIMLTRFRVRWR